MRRLVLVLFAVCAAGCSLIEDHFDECSVNTDCPVGRFCVQSYCVTANCNDVYGLPDAGDAIAIGAALPLTTATGQVDTGQKLDFDAFLLALDEINQRRVNGRPFAVYACDTENEVLLLENELNYLVSLKKISAVLTSHSSQALAAAADAVSQGVLMMSATATSPELTTLNANAQAPDGTTVRMLWRTAPSDVIQGHVIANLLLGGADAGYPSLAGVTKLGILYGNDPYGQGLAQAIESFLVVPGSTITVGPFPFTPGDDATAAVNSLDSFAPDLTVAIGFPSDLVPILKKTAQLPALAHHTDGTGHRWFFTDSAESADLTSDPVAAAEVQGALGAAPAQGAGIGYATFSQSFKNAYAVDPSTTSFTAHSYDAMYLLALGAAWATGTGNGAVTGPAIAEGLTHVSSSATFFELGPTSFTTAAAALEQGQSVNVQGTSGDLDFDSTTGEAPSDISIWQVTDAGIHTVATLPPP